MQKISSRAELKAAIQELEGKLDNEWPLLKKDFFNTYESLKPINIFKSTLKEAIASPGLKTDVINGAIGLTTGILAKKVILGKTLNPLTKLLGIILEMAVANKVTKNADGVRSVGTFIMKKIFTRQPDLEKK
ncbi:MAG: hypothetical protein IPP96_14260 [Chitinophagaceae bacterium]|nr:hypothetical protein [Chitinophagaceae bacterium]